VAGEEVDGDEAASREDGGMKGEELVGLRSQIEVQILAAAAAG
jgi:hypothetical protein